ncbi:sigma-54-dependent Fis family transcriptional regulator (plasmid) [Paracoccus liaowanqingii]|uniref:Sigma-54-dependent Fis family transcriptional regulator n=3 Tax=Paracoccus liaowanqingii TaxID=2560053 RepID=A0A4Y5STD6_9RHOB|nr:sigma-54-dependent Fis family transcriptional regulator [Paracoccus liaowanqingii]
MRGRIAFIDDEAPLCAAAADWLEASGFEVATFTDPAEALAGIRAEACDCVVTDLRMPGLSGQQVLDALRGQDPDLPVILLSGHADVPVAVAAMRTGAHDFLEKPYRAEHLVEVLDRAVDLRRMRREARIRRASPLSAGRLETRLPGNSPALHHLRRAVQHLADLPLDLMLVGEPGSGRSEVARCLHDLGRRARRPFVVIHGAGLPDGALEAELLGHERGHLAGVSGARAGRLEQAQGGTLYLADLQAVPLSVQARLMRVLQAGAVERIGGQTARPVDLRLIAAVEGDPAALVAQGRLRPDLFHRLSAGALHIPPLRDRAEDVPALFTAMAEAAAARLGLPMPDLRPADLDRLSARPWPGNLAELRASAERAVLALPAGPAPAGDAPSLPDRMARVEAQIIAEALAVADGSSARAADALGIPRRTLNEKIARHGLRAD